MPPCNKAHPSQIHHINPLCKPHAIYGGSSGRPDSSASINPRYTHATQRVFSQCQYFTCAHTRCSYNAYIMLGTADSPTQATMPLFELAVATAVLTLYGCFSCTVSICSRDDDDRGHGRPYPASPTGYGSITTQPAHRPLPSPSYQRDRHIPSKSTVKTPLIPGHGGNPTRGHISQQPGQSRPPVVPHHTTALAVRAHHFLRVPADLLPHYSPLRPVIRMRVTDPANAKRFAVLP